MLASHLDTDFRLNSSRRQNAIVDLVERLRSWSFRRQRLDPPAREPLAALREIVAVYSAHPSGPLALHARSTGLTANAFAELEKRKLAIRIVGMRGSAFIVPLDTADRVVAATRRPLPPSYLAGRGLDAKTYARLKLRVLAAIAEPVTPTQLRSALGARSDDQLPYFAMRVMAREGLVIRLGSGRVRTDDLRWVATEAWLGRPFEDLDPDQALAWLAGAYLDAFGPARVADFAWWVGIPRQRAEIAVATAATVDVRAGLLLPEAQVDAWAAIKPIEPDAVAVLGKWDPYAMGYAPDGRHRFVDDIHLGLAYSTTTTRVGATSGDALPMILLGGRAVAGWTHRLAGGRIEVEVRPFPGTHDRNKLLKRVRPAFEAIAELLGGRLALS
jgi:hypothetical protein